MTIKKETICLITPPSPFLLDERVFMHLGILKVASSLESQGHHVEFLDLSGVENFLDVMNDYCNNTSITTFGLTASTPQVPFAVNVAKKIRDIIPNAKIILGGPHVTLMNTACKREAKKGLHLSDRASQDIQKLSKIFDVLVCGDGELTIFEALKIKKGIVDADKKVTLFFNKSKIF